MTDVTNNNNFPEVREILQSKSLKSHIRHRLHTLDLTTFLSEKEVLDYVVLLYLIKKRQFGLQLNQPVSWARLISTQYINTLYKNRMSEATEFSRVGCPSDCNSEEIPLH